MIGVLLSGGIDSLAMLELASIQDREVLAIYINWGQPAHWYEDTATIKICKHYGIHRKVINAPFINVSAMMQNPGALGPRFVRGRNLAFVSMALATVPGLEEIWLGAIKDDFDDYYDCRTAYIIALNLVLAYSGLHVKAPLIHLTKKQVHDFCEFEAVPVDLAWSCYEAKDGKPCKTCNSCRSNDPKTWISVLNAGNS